jgi:hypothetical protein
MEDIIRQKIIAFGTTRKKGPYKDSTVRLYMTNLVNFHRMVQPDLPFDSMAWARDFDFVKNILSKVPNLQTKRNYLNSVVTALQTLEFEKDLIDKYITLRDLFASQYDSAGYLTPNQAKIMGRVKKEDIMKFLNREPVGLNGHHLQTNLKEFQMWLVMNIHTRYPFRNELGDMCLIRRKLFDKLTHEKQLENNWYVLEKGWTHASFVLTKYKTFHNFGIKTIEVEPKYCRLIHKLFQIKGKKLADINNTPLLTWANGSNITRNQLSTLLTGYTTEKLGASISTTLLAKYFGTSAVDPANPTEEEVIRMKDEADCRGHSLATKFTIYS